MIKKILIVSALSLSLTACDFFESSKARVEQQYLAENVELKQAIETIREQGLSVVAQSAEQGDFAACVAKQLNGDPMGALIEVEGALQDSANLSDLLNTISGLTEQEISLESIPQLLQQGADTVNYLRTLLGQYDLAELKTQVTELVENGHTKSQDIGQHLRGLVENCQ
jgi:hypothetical protein